MTKSNAWEQARVASVQQPEALAGCAASHDVHVAIGLALDPVAIAKKGFQKGADASTELDHVDGARLGNQGARKVAQSRERGW